MFSADAFMNTMRAWNSVHRVRLRVDHAHAGRLPLLLVVDAPSARPSRDASVRLPVFAAHGSVDEFELK